MREIDVNEIIDNVTRLCMDANYTLGEDVLNTIKRAIMMVVIYSRRR